MIRLNEIIEARVRIRDGIYFSPCPASLPLSDVTASDVYCKLEYLQRTGSFKERGARNALLRLNEQEKGKGVITASAGNHALALAYHGKLLGIDVTVVMPRFAPLTKVSSSRSLGAKVFLHGNNFEEAYEHALSIAREGGMNYISGFDDPSIIAGQGTMGLEILEQVPDLEAIVVPVGGGGLIAGVSVAIKESKPDVLVIGVEPKGVASFSAALEENRPVRVASAGTLADGLAVQRVGEHALETARSYIDRMVTVSERAIARAILRLIELERSVVEGAGAAGLAALLSGRLPELTGKKTVLPLCGGNIDTPVLGRIIERGLVADGRLSRFESTISDRPGGLARFTAIIAEEEASVRDIAHDRAFSGEDIDKVVVHCVVETRDSDHILRLRNRLSDEGFEVRFREF